MRNSLILASQSPYRKSQMEQLGFAFQCEAPSVDERALQSQWSGPLQEAPLMLARAKAEAVAKDHPEAIVIGSDQMLIFENQSFPKPKSLQEVVDRLLAMQGKVHELHTALCVRKGNDEKATTVVARMHMRSLKPTEVQSYAEMDEPIGCAGGYKIEKKGMLLFKEIETSDHSSIIGLPMLSLVSFLRDWGISIL